MSELELIAKLLIGFFFLKFVFGAFSRAVRIAALKRANFCCEDCEKSWDNGYMLDVHHKKPMHRGGDSTINNAKVVCLEHHEKAHRDLAKEAYKRGDKKSANADAWAARTIEKRRKNGGDYHR